MITDSGLFVIGMIIAIVLLIGLYALLILTPFPSFPV